MRSLAFFANEAEYNVAVNHRELLPCKKVSAADGNEFFDNPNYSQNKYNKPEKGRFFGLCSSIKKLKNKEI